MKNYCKKSLKKIMVAGGVVAFLAAASSAFATQVEYTATSNGGGNYTLEFNVINDTLPGNIDELVKSIFYLSS